MNESINNDNALRRYPELRQLVSVRDASWVFRPIQDEDAIKVCLIGWNRHIVVEVVDEHDQELVLPDDIVLPGDSGLGLVDARGGRWGSRLTQTGRVMWAELAVYERTPAGLPRRRFEGGEEW
ncbi:hypothetical protein [Amycolatopsis sp. lyj-23]|uniref:hypothetical protein n=1 Tax=Amycolatopsis sp. lyj-23 TaxID=2789283 RepID=UPI00397D114F